jgi:CBS domain-containing protein
MDNALARDLMSRPVRSLSSRTPVREAAGFLTHHGISGAPVEDDRGRWLGVFSMTDIARAVASRLSPPPAERSLEAREPVPPDSASSLETLATLQVGDVMTPGMVTVFPDSSVGEVLRSLLKFKVHRVFVIQAESGSLVGVITSMDVLSWLGHSRDPAAAVRGEPRNP